MDSLISSATYSLSGPSGFTFSQSTFANNGASSSNVATTPAITLTAGDFVFMMCQGGNNGTTIAASSSVPETWVPLTYLNGAGSIGPARGFYVSSATAGSTTFTCTTGAATAFQQAAVMVYHTAAPATGVLIAGTDFSANNVCINSLTCASGAITTAQPSLVIACGEINNVGNWTAGSIGGTSATLRVSGSAGPVYTSTNPVCEDALFTGGIASATSSLTQTQGTVAWNMIGAAFK